MDKDYNPRAQKQMQVIDNEGQQQQEQFEISDPATTLEEPVLETILRDLKEIGFKIKFVLAPSSMSQGKAKQLRNWDLWGPLLLCLSLSLTLSLASSAQSEMVFATIFVVIWVGAGVVTLNAKLLGGKASFLQSVCVLGYCIFPINISAFICTFIMDSMIITKIILLSVSFLWSTYASVGFMEALVSEDKRILAVYPVFLFYLFLSWYCLIVN